MNQVAEQIKDSVTMRYCAEHYGFEPNMAGFIRCPFHSGDRTASMKLYPGRGGFYCYGCNAHGSVIDFVMKLFDIDYKQAVVRISNDFGLGLTAKRENKYEYYKRLAEKRKAELEHQAFLEKYAAVAAEHRYWNEVLKYFSPKQTNGFIHPLYAEAVKMLPRLEFWLNENIGGDCNR